MNMSDPITDREQILNSLIELCELSDQPDLASFLRSSYFTISIDFEPYVGYCGHDVLVKVPLHVFAATKPQHDQYRNMLSEHLTDIFNSFTDTRLGEIQITLDLTSSPPGAESPVLVSSSEADRIWQIGKFRLFISHSSRDRAIVTALAESFAKRRIQCYLAHINIEPIKVWPEELKKALSSCHAILYFSTADANNSYWCQQEVGWGHGRGILVVSVNASAPPVGFLSSSQAFNGGKLAKDNAWTLREDIIKCLVKEPRTAKFMHEPLIISLSGTNDATSANIIMDNLMQFNNLNDDELSRIRSRIVENESLSSDPSLMEKLSTLLSRFNVEDVQTSIGDDDFDPFAE